jgi:hypothetical protein
VREVGKMTEERFIKALERATGRSLEYLRQVSLEDWRAEVDARFGRRRRFRSYYPHVGRGNVLRDRVRDHDDVEADFERAMNAR